MVILLAFGPVMALSPLLIRNTNMFAAFRMFFATLTALFSATEKLANAANHSAAFVEGEAAGFNERTSLTRVQELKRLRSQFSIEDQQLAVEEAAARRNLDKTVQEAAQTKAAKDSTNA